MISIVREVIRDLFLRLGYKISRTDPGFPPDFDDATVSLIQSVRPFTGTTKERVFALLESVEYIVKHNIPGDIVECGVGRGGSMMAVAQTLKNIGASRKIYLFDTFEGMTEPTDVDKDFRGKSASEIFRKEYKNTDNNWCLSSLDEVKRNLWDTGYDKNQIVFVKGKVEDTIPAYAPDQISLLRLDTDWYESTYHELVHLYSRLSVGGVLIIDDYGHWEGAKKAVDQFIDENQLKVLLNRIDYTGRICVKIEA